MISREIFLDKGWALNSVTDVFIREKREILDNETEEKHRDEGNVKVKAEIAGIYLKATNTKDFWVC